MAHSRSDRRGFLKMAGALPVTAAAPVTLLAADNKTSPSGLMLERRHFEPLLGESFALASTNAEVATSSVKLRAVSDVPCCTSHQQSFRLVFDASGNVPQALWELTHPALGTHAVFLSPNDAAGREVEAVFNRG